MKAIYNEDVTFEDLREIFDAQEFKSYETLKTLSQEDLLASEIYFVHQFGDNQVDLQPNGSCIQVTKENVGIYLDLIAMHTFKESHKAAVDAFQKGFN